MRVNAQQLLMNNAKRLEKNLGRISAIEEGKIIFPSLVGRSYLALTSKKSLLYANYFLSLKSS